MHLTLATVLMLIDVFFSKESLIVEGLTVINLRGSLGEVKKHIFSVFKETEVNCRSKI